MNNSVILSKDEIKILGKLLFSLISDALDSLNSEYKGEFNIDRFTFHTYTHEHLDLVYKLGPKKDSRGIFLKLDGILNGSYLLTFDKKSVFDFVESIAGKDFIEEEGVDVAINDVLGEIGNITANKIIGRLTNSIGSRNTTSVPRPYDMEFPDFVTEIMGENNGCMAVLDASIKDPQFKRNGHILIFFTFPNETELHQTFTFLHEKISDENDEEEEQD